MLKKTKLISLILLSGAFVVPAGASAETAPFKQETNISQQNGKVTCIVEDSFGPVIGASVVIKGTTNGNVTDMDGKVVLEGLKYPTSDISRKKSLIADKLMSGLS